MDLVEHINEAMIKAQRDHISWTRYGIGWSAEYLLTTSIAQGIAPLLNKTVEGIYVEYSIQDLATNEGNMEISEELRTGRCDICIDFSDKTHSIIEVKNTVTQQGAKYESIIKDIKRIRLFLLGENSFENSYVCFIASGSTSQELLKKKIKYWIKEMKKYSDKDLNFEPLKKNLNFKPHYEFFCEESKEHGEWHWASVVIKLEPKI